MAGAAIIKPAAVVINALEIESDKIEAPPSSPYKATRVKRLDHTDHST